MSELDLLEVAIRVARALEESGVVYVLGGSVASSVQGEPRYTNDIDFAVKLTENQVPNFARRLGPEFDVDEEMLADAVRRRRSANIYFLPLVTKIDLFVRGAEPLDASEFARRSPIVLREGAPPVFIASREDNLLRKLNWYREGGGVSDAQWRDILGILRVAGAELDREYLRAWAPRLGVADLLEAALRDASSP